MSNLNNLPPPRVPMLDPATGLVTREWYRWFSTVFNLTGAGQSDLTVLQLQDIVDAQPLAETTVESEVAPLRVRLQALEAAPVPDMSLDPATIPDLRARVEALEVVPLDEVEPLGLQVRVEALEAAPTTPDQSSYWMSLAKQVQALELAPSSSQVELTETFEPVIGAPVLNDLLQYNGTDWVNVSSPTLMVKDTLFTLIDEVDTTKKAQFQLSGLTTGTTRTYTFPDTSSTLADLATAQTYTAAKTHSAALTTNAALNANAGITFPATQVASAGANVLDDYEEGTCTLTATAASGTITTASVSASYTKIGRLVCVTGVIDITNNGTGAGTLLINGLPFSVSVTSCGAGRETATSGWGCAFMAVAGETRFQVYNTSGAYPVLTGSSIMFGVTYLTTT